MPSNSSDPCSRWNTPNSLCVLHIEPGAVIADEQHNLAGSISLRTDLDGCLRPVPRIFQRIADQVHEHEPQHGRIAIDIRQPSDRPCHRSVNRRSDLCPRLRDEVRDPDAALRDG